MKLTELEIKVLDVIPKDDFYEEGLESCLWADCFIDTIKRYAGVEATIARGVIASLSKKKYINFYNSGKDSQITLLDNGKEYLKNK